MSSALAIATPGLSLEEGDRILLPQNIAALI